MISAALSALIANILGAFGTHALKKTIDASFLVVFQTGVQYQFYHSLALFIPACLMFHIQNRWLTLSGLGFISGCILFSGSLYFLAITNTKWLGMITPIGGLAFMAGWVFLITGILKAKL